MRQVESFSKSRGILHSACARVAGETLLRQVGNFIIFAIRKTFFISSYERLRLNDLDSKKNILLSREKLVALKRYFLFALCLCWLARSSTGRKTYSNEMTLKLQVNFSIARLITERARGSDRRQPSRGERFSSRMYEARE